MGLCDDIKKVETNVWDLIFEAEDWSVMSRLRFTDEWGRQLEFRDRIRGYISPLGWKD